MPVVFTGICSHSPLLVDQIGKKHRKKLQATLAAAAELERQLYAARPETIVVITPHGEAGDAFVLGAAPHFSANFERFGDFSLRGEWPADPGMTQAIRAADESQRHPFAVRFSSQSVLDHGTSVPLVLLAGHLPQIRPLPVHTATLTPTAHWQFGRFLGDQFRSTGRRVSVVASADLSHRLTPESPAGYSPQASAFDRQVLELLRRGDTAGVVNLDAGAVTEVACCGYLPIVVLLGVLDGMRCRPTVLGYEAPFGVGHLLAYFDLAE